MKNAVLNAVLLGILSVCLASSLMATEPSIKLVNPQHGPATIQGDNSMYYYFKGRIETAADTNVVFKQNTCVLVGKDGKKHTDYWIYLAGWSTSFNETNLSPVTKKSLYVLEEKIGSKPASKWNASKVDGKMGSITYRIPKGGFAELHFLWPVSKDFEPKRVTLTGLVDLAL